MKQRTIKVSAIINYVGHLARKKNETDKQKVLIFLEVKACLLKKMIII